MNAIRVLRPRQVNGPSLRYPPTRRSYLCNLCVSKIGDMANTNTSTMCRSVCQRRTVHPGFVQPAQVLCPRSSCASIINCSQIPSRLCLIAMRSGLHVVTTKDQHCRRVVFVYHNTQQWLSSSACLAFGSFCLRQGCL